MLNQSSNVIYVVMEVGGEYNDEYTQYYSDMGNPRTFFNNKQEADKYADELNKKLWKNWRQECDLWTIKQYEYDIDKLCERINELTEIPPISYDTNIDIKLQIICVQITDSIWEHGRDLFYRITPLSRYYVVQVRKD